MTTRSTTTLEGRSKGALAWATDVRLGGALLFVAGSILLMGIISAEALYPAPYSTGANAISDLGGTQPPNSIVLQPSATIFDATMIASGLLVALGAVFVQRAFGRRSLTVTILILGVAALGVGVFPGNTGNPHAISALVTFTSGGVAAVLSAAVIGGPFRYLSILLGGISLAALVSYFLLGQASPLMALGEGGLERWVAYPILLWLTGFGGYLAGRPVGAAAVHDRRDRSSGPWLRHGRDGAQGTGVD